MGADVPGEFSLERTATTSGPSSGTQPLLGQHEQGGGRDGEHDPAAARRRRRQLVERRRRRLRRRRRRRCCRRCHSCRFLLQRLSFFCEYLIPL